MAFRGAFLSRNMRPAGLCVRSPGGVDMDFSRVTN